MTAYLAVDLGAESGRLVRGELDAASVLSIEEVHRWPNEPVMVEDRLHWDVFRLWHEIKSGLREAVLHGDAASVAVDSWGVDYALLDDNGNLVENPVHYRDDRTLRGVTELDRRISRSDLYEATGIQFMPINTSCQLAAARDDAGFKNARALLGIPDLFTYWLSGTRIAERTFASTTQLYDTRSREWSRVVLDALEVDAGMLQELVDPGSKIAGLAPALAKELDTSSALAVVAAAAHDTASAVVGVPAEGEDWAFISSGTWSLVGMEVPRPIISPLSRDANFTNEEGFDSTTRFLKNVMGLWVVQECRRSWERRNETYSYNELVRMAEDAKPWVAVIDPDDEAFLRPGDMPDRIASYLERTGQRLPPGPGALIRCILESLALKYQAVLAECERLSGRTVQTIHVVGGGARNGLLNQLVADVTERPVLAGPVEATVIGNLVVQALVHGQLASFEEMRAAVRRSVSVTKFTPDPKSYWSKASDRFRNILNAPSIRSNAGCFGVDAH
jgi:rhamnulokinase